MDYCYGKNRLNFGLDSAQNGRMVAILNFRYSLYKIIIYRAYMCTVCFSSTFAAASPLLALAEIRGLLTCHPCVLIFINEMCLCILCMLYCQCIVNQLVVRLYTRWPRSAYSVRLEDISDSYVDTMVRKLQGVPYIHRPTDDT